MYFPPEIENLILSFLPSCDLCGVFLKKDPYTCMMCSPGIMMCISCYHTRSLHCSTAIWYHCRICNKTHNCFNHGDELF